MGDLYDTFPLLSKGKVKPSSDILNDSPSGVTLAWQDLSVYVPIRKSSGLPWNREKTPKPFKRVINNVSGIVYPGSFMAVMGASGAGKTTLVNVLANRVPGNIVVDGDIRINGTPTGIFINEISGYVYQDDLFTGTLTVIEHLSFMAHLKLDRRLRPYERKRRVEELLVELSLKKCENTRIGTPGQTGISGGERKRLAFASEIISGCPLLFTDEPTTGLDSFSAQKIVGMMKNLASKGKTVICTIHQPNSQVFSMFDQLCLLAEGRTAYLGPARDAPAFMEKMGFVLPENHNPADFYIRALAIQPGKEVNSHTTIRKICETFSNSEEGKDIESKVQSEVSQLDSLSTSFSSSRDFDSKKAEVLKANKIRKPFWWTQLYWLTWRAMLDSKRNPRVHLVRTIQKIVLAFLVGLCFASVKLDQKGIQDIQGAIFVFITESTFPSLYGVIHVFPYELPIFLRENKNGLYRTSSYYLSKVIALLPGFILEPAIFVTIAYWIIGMRETFQAYFITILIAILTANTAAACGCFFSAAFDNVSLAITALIPFDYMLMITGGLFIKLGTLPAGLAWMKFLSWFMYANEALQITQWSSISNITCDADPALPCIKSGQEVLASRSFEEKHFSLDVIGLILLYTFFHFAAYISLILRSRRM